MWATANRGVSIGVGFAVLTLLALAGGCGSSSGTMGAGGPTGAAGTNATAGRGGTTGVAGTIGAAGRGGTSGGAGNAGSGGAPMPSAGCNSTAARTSGRFTIDVAGTQREYIIKLPANYDASHPYKIVFMFHGAMYSAQRVA